MTDDGVVPQQPAVAQSVPPAQPAPPPHDIFRGPNGLRAGWRVLLFLVLVVALSIGLAVILLLVAGRPSGFPGAGFASTLTPFRLSVTEGTTLLVCLLAAFFMSRIERGNFSAYGLPLRFAFGKYFWIGTLAGFAAISASLLGIFVFHGFRLTGVAIHGKTLVAAVVAWSAAFVIVGLSEEFAFRGYLQYTLTTGMGFWPSALLLSLLFGAAHTRNPGETIFGLSSVVLFGLLFCLFLRRTGNLWWAVGFHAGWDWGQTFFYGVPDSGISPHHSLFYSSFSGPRWLTGGTVGPEASVFTPVALLIVALLFSRAYREVPSPAEKLNAAAVGGPTTS